MSKRTGVEALKFAQSIKPASHAAGTITGTGVLVRDFDDLMVALDAGVFAATGDATLKLQESDDDGVADAYADIPGAVMSNKPIASDEAPYVGNVNLAKRKHWIRAVVTVADDACIFSVPFILGAARKRPVTQVNTVEFSI